MATILWRGDQAARAQVNTITPANVNIGNTFTVTINSKAITFTATAATVANVTAGLVALLQASTIPEFQEVTWADATTAITGTSSVAGRPFTQTSSASGGTATLTTSTTTANTSPNDWNDAANWSPPGVPANSDDVYVENSASSILYGLDQNAVTLTSLNVAQSFTGRIGLPRVTASGYWEYRDTYLKVSATTVNVGRGDGGGSGRIKLNVGTAQATVNVSGTGQTAEQGVPSFLFVGTHASNAMTITQGSVGVGYFNGEAATVATLRVGSESNPAADVSLIVGAGVTLTTLDQYGGTALVQCALTTHYVLSGTATLFGSGAVTTLTVDQGGTVYYETTGTLTTLAVAGGGTIDFTRDPRARTVTNTTLEARATLLDPTKSVTFTNAIALSRAGLQGANAVVLDLGYGINLQRS